MKILILGAGNAQIDAIEYCKKNGYEVYGCSYTNADKGIPLLDHFKQLDIKNAEGIKKYVIDEKIDAVYSVGSDLAIPTVMRVCSDLGLRHFISPEVADICQNKHIMRQTLGEDFEGNIPFAVCKNLDEARSFTAFPGMMKPVDSQGQRGCFKVESLKDIEENFEHSMEYSKSKNVIIEKFIDGPEVSVNAYMQDGEMKFALVSDRVVFDEFPGGIIKRHLLPTKHQNSKDRIIDLTKRIAEKLEINNGPLYAQVKLDGDTPIILEVTPRLDGCHMWNLIRHYSGNDLLEAAFRHLLFDEKISFKEVDESKNMELAFMCEAPGKAFDRSKYDISKSIYHMWYYENGDTVKQLNGFMEKCGYQIVE